MATLPSMQPHLMVIPARVRRILDGHDRYVAAMAGAHTSAISPWNARPQPTAAQATAGNYKVGPVKWHGIGIQIEE